MEMLWVIVDSAHKMEVEGILLQVGVQGFSELGPVLGTGSTRPRLDSAAFPGSSVLLLSWVSADRVLEVQRALEEFRTRSGCHLYLASWPIELRISGDR